MGVWEHRSRGADREQTAREPTGPELSAMRQNLWVTMLGPGMSVPWSGLATPLRWVESLQATVTVFKPHHHHQLFIRSSSSTLQSSEAYALTRAPEAGSSSPAPPPSRA